MSTSDPANYESSPGDQPMTTAVNFYRRFLPVVSEKTGAIGAVAWDCTTLPYKVIGQYVDSGKTMQINLSEQEHLKLLQRTNDGKQSVLFAETSSDTHTQTVALSPILRQGASEIVEIVFDNTISEDARQQVGSALASYCKAADQISSEPIQSPPTSQPTPSATTQPVGLNSEQQATANSSFAAIDNYARAVHRSLDLKKTSFEIANEMQAMVDCDRVAVLQKIGSRWKSIAFSGQSELAARSNTIRDLESLVGRQMATNQPLYIADEDGNSEPAEIENRNYKNSFDVYKASSGFKEIAILPLREKSATATNLMPGNQPNAPEDQAVEESPIIGAIVIEQFGNQSFAGKRQGIQLLTQHAESAFQNSVAHQNLPFFGVINRLGNLSTFRLRGRRNKLLAAMTIAGIIAFILTFVPVEFKIAADGVLLPEQRRNIFAEVDGEVTKVWAEHGADVKKDDLLIELSSDQLKIYLEDLTGKLETTEKQIEAIDQARMRADQQRGANLAQASLLNVERTKLEGSMKTLNEELGIAIKQQEKLRVLSPIDGQVLSWQLAHQLENRPISQGQRLLEIGKLDGPWIVEINVPDKEVGKILMAQRRSKDPLKVTFMIASDSSKSYSGEVIEIAKSTGTDPVAGQTAKVKVKIDESELDFRQVRTDVRAKIHCGKASLGYVWLHDLFEFVQSKVFFGLF